jgi:hypothetical protein
VRLGEQEQIGVSKLGSSKSGSDSSQVTERVQQPVQAAFWRESKDEDEDEDEDEVDFVFQYREGLCAIKVKSGRKKLAR